MTKSLSIDLLRLDAGTQNRISINEDVVEDYAELIEASGKWPFSPLDVFHDGTDYYVADGFHRTLAATRAKRSSVPCTIHKGTAEDARIFGMTANDSHGLRMSRADKKACVEWLLDNRPRMIQAEIASKAGVSLRLVKYTVAERNHPKVDKKVQIAPSATKPVHDSIIAGGKSGGVPTSSSSGPASPGPTSGDAADSVAAGRDARTSEGTPGAPKGGSNPPATTDYGKCPNCAGTKWTADEFGVTCAKCGHVHGECLGDPDETGEASKKERAKVMRLKLIKTVEACQRAVDDMHELVRRPVEHKQGEELTKQLLRLAKGWPA